MNRFTLRAVAAAAFLSLAIGTFPVAANASDSQEELDALLSRIAPETLVGLQRPDGLFRSQKSPAATVPTTTDKPINVHGEDGTDLSIWIPEATGVENHNVAGASVKTFEHGDGFRTVPLPKNDGSVQVLTVLDNEAAPEIYTYQLGLPLDSAVQQLAGGFITFNNADGTFAGGIAPAWAHDSNGANVPTHYEINGTTLTQVVKHVGKGFAYPIVADPWLGKALYGKPYIARTKDDKKHKGYSIGVRPTTWGKVWKQIETWWAHRDEVKTKLGKNKNKWTNSIQEQFYCHIAGSPISANPDYNMESWRRTMNWAAQIRYNCGPPKK